MEPLEPGNRQEARRPLLMDPAGARPSGFAPPTALTPTGAAESSTPGIAVAGAAGVPVAPPGPPLVPTTPSVLAGAPSGVLAGTGNGVVPGEASFGPVSQVVRVSVRTLSSRIDLVLPDRSTFAETLETVLELAPRSLREQAIAHGGWILRTAAGEAVPGSTTLLDQGIVDGTTLFLSGIDAADSAEVYDDVADAVADTVLGDPSAWPAGGSRTVALAAAGLFAAVVCLSLLWVGPPWTAIAIALGAVAVFAQIAAGLLARRVGDSGIATVSGLLSVAAGAAAATVATAGSAPLRDIGSGHLLLGAAAATVLATTSALSIGTNRVPFAAIITGSLLLCAALSCSVIFDLPPVGGAAIVAGVALALMPAVPAVSLRLARFELEPLPTTAAGVYADHETVDTPDVRSRTRQAVGYVTALIQGLTWPAMAACIVLAFSQNITAEILAGIVGVGLLLRARLFITIGQRIPLLAAGIISITALMVALMVNADEPMVPVAVACCALVGLIVCLLLATRRRRVSPALTRTAEIVELLIAVAVVPLVAGVLGLFGLIRGLGG